MCILPLFSVCVFIFDIYALLSGTVICVFVVKSHEKFMKNSHSHTGNMERTPFDCMSSIFKEKCINIYTGVYYCYIYGANKKGKGLVKSVFHDTIRFYCVYVI